jgi:histone-lysine N-methyltransferase SETMAR
MFLTEKSKKPLTAFFEMSMFEVRAVIRFLALKGLTNNNITLEIHAVYGEDAVAHPTVKKWAKRFREGRTSLEDDPREGRPLKSDLVEPIENMLAEHPFISCKKICAKLSISKGTCLRILREELGLKKFNLRWVPHTLTTDQMQNRVNKAREMLDIFDGIPPCDWWRIVTGDQSWFFYDTPPESGWAASREDLPTIPRRCFKAKKVLITIIWNVTGIVSLLALESGSRFNSYYFCTEVIPDMEVNLLRGTRKKTLRDYLLHLDNAPAHNSEMSKERIAKSKLTRVPHPAYSPDLAPSDFFLFGYMKERQKGKMFKDTEALLLNIREIFENMDLGLLERVIQSWISRLRWVLVNGGRYFE